MTTTTTNSDELYTGDNSPANIRKCTEHSLIQTERDILSLTAAVIKLQKKHEENQVKIAKFKTARSQKMEKREILQQVMEIYQKHERPQFNAPQPSTFNVAIVGSVPKGTATKQMNQAPVRKSEKNGTKSESRNSSRSEGIHSSRSEGFSSFGDGGYPCGPSGQLYMYKDILMDNYPESSSWGTAGSQEIPNFAQLSKKERKRALKKLAKKLILKSRNPKSPATPNNGTKRRRNEGSSSSPSSSSLKRPRFDRSF